MADITSLDDLNGSPITDEQLLGLKARLLVRITNLTTGTDDLFDFKEHGEAGFEVNPSALLEQLRKMVEMVDKSLADPATRGDFGYVVSQWDNPAL